MSLDMPQAMQHLDPERLAAFDHDAPSVDELAHLASCAACRSEHDAFTALGLLTMRDAVPRLTEWDALATALRADGLLTVAPAAAARVRTSRVVMRPWRRAAAAAAVLVGGAMAGRVSAGASALPFIARSTDSVRASVRAVSTGVSDTFVSVGQATDVLSSAQRNYENASLWLAANDTTVRSSDVYRARLAALDQMMTASRAALRDGPQDPVLNHYYLAAYTAREATLQQLGGTLPVDKTIEGY